MLTDTQILMILKAFASCASLLVNLLTRKGIMRADEGAVVASQGQCTIRAGQDF